jgi:hypothetical protein
MSEMEGFDYAERVYDDHLEISGLTYDCSSDEDFMSTKINDWLSQMPRW